MFKLLKFLYQFSFKSIRRVSTFYWSWIATLTVGSYQSKPHVNFKSKFSKYTTLGFNTHFNGMEITGEGKVIIGNNFHSGKQCKIITSFHNYMGNKIPYDESYIHREVIIEDNVWLGDNVLILGGVTIGEGAIIQAGSVVVKPIPKLAIAGGHPAIPFKFRDEQHYYTLKTEGRYH